MSHDAIIIEGLEVDAHIGITEEEHQHFTRLRIDAKIKTSLEQAAQLDDISKTIDYAYLRSHIITEVKTNQAHLIETLASNIISKIKNTFNVESVELSIFKINIFDDTAAIGIRMKR